MPLRLQMSDEICTALQLINFWQDLGVDIPRGRIYLPADAWTRHGVDEAQLLALQANPSTTGLIAEHVRAARAMMLKGAPLAKKIPGRGGWELRLVVQGGLRILDKVEAQGFNTLQRRPRLNPWDLMAMGWRALFM
jgi:phytoene/squalene synthetase